MDEEEWQVATSGRRRRNGRRGAAAAGPGQHHTGHAMMSSRRSKARSPTERQVQRFLALVGAATIELAVAPFWQHLMAQLEQLSLHCALNKLHHMVLYGLGSLEQPGAVHIRYQLAAAKLLAGLLPLAAAAEAFDPVFTALDRATLSHCCIEVSSLDEGGRRLAHVPTLFFMPHCEAVLTDGLLAANLAAGTLHNVVVLGNRFSGYRLAWSLPRQAQQQQQQQLVAGLLGADGSAAAERPDTMLWLCERNIVQELRVCECRFPVSSAFNDLGLHWFPLDWRQRLDSIS